MSKKSADGGEAVCVTEKRMKISGGETEKTETETKREIREEEKKKASKHQ